MLSTFSESVSYRENKQDCCTSYKIISLHWSILTISKMMLHEQIFKTKVVTLAAADEFRRFKTVVTSWDIMKSRADLSDKQRRTLMIGCMSSLDSLA